MFAELLVEFDLGGRPGRHPLLNLAHILGARGKTDLVNPNMLSRQLTWESDRGALEDNSPFEGTRCQVPC